MKIDQHTIFEIHRLNDLNWSERKIARYLRIGRSTVKKYLNNPDHTSAKRKKRASKLDVYRELINQLLKQDPQVKAPVVLQRIRNQGFDGRITIVRDYLLKLRGRQSSRRAFIRFESPPGKQLQIDWGHFGHLQYGQTKRKLYALAVIESYSRMLYAQFTHSQKQETLHQCLLNAFRFFGGTAREIVVDNMVTAVIERQGSLIRFNGAFLQFLRPFKIVPVACNRAAPHEKGKIENSIKYLRQNFWPLRTFTDLADVQLQVRQWLDTVANVRIHQTTGEKPKERFAKVDLRPLPDLLPDCRETCLAKVHKDFAVRFDGNIYTTPPWTIGKKVTIKADPFAVSIYLNQKKIAAHHRCWQRKKRIESPAHLHQIKKIQKKLWHDKQIAAFLSLGAAAVDYFKALVESRQPIKKSVLKLLALKDEYGSASLLYAIQKATTFFGRL
ncbi:MAG: IS21 family transposase [Thermodesulfobacteriota bacterium]|nr:IS21 family transposase [Thermodesulfobacteriota bacterium]